LRDAATELGAGQAEFIAQDPEKWHVVFDIDLVQGSIDPELHPVVLHLSAAFALT
jgi:hypothetical protein